MTLRLYRMHSRIKLHNPEFLEVLLYYFYLFKINHLIIHMITYLNKYNRFSETVQNLIELEKTFLDNGMHKSINIHKFLYVRSN